MDEEGSVSLANGGTFLFRKQWVNRDQRGSNRLVTESSALGTDTRRRYATTKRGRHRHIESGRIYISEFVKTQRRLAAIAPYWALLIELGAPSARFTTEARHGKPHLTSDCCPARCKPIQVHLRRSGPHTLCSQPRRQKQRSAHDNPTQKRAYTVLSHPLSWTTARSG